MQTKYPSVHYENWYASDGVVLNHMWKHCIIQITETEKKKEKKKPIEKPSGSYCCC